MHIDLPIDQLETKTKLTIEKRLRLTDIMTKQIPLRNMETLQKIKGKGFSNHKQHNQKRHHCVYTTAEKLFDDYQKSKGFKLLHEVSITTKDRDNKIRIYHLDFFDPFKRLNIEINPKFHKTYEIVRLRDILRRKLLKQLGIRSLSVTVNMKAFKGNGKDLETTIDKKRASYVLRELNNMPISKLILDNYI